MDAVTDDQGDAPAEPLLRVVKGDPSAEELGALVAVVAALGGPAAPATRRTPVWNAPARMQRPVLRQGPGAWRSSGLPSPARTSS